MNWHRAALMASTSVLIAACAAVPGEELGTVQPREPVPAAEREKVYPIDVYDPGRASIAASTSSTRSSTASSSSRSSMPTST